MNNLHFEFIKLVHLFSFFIIVQMYPNNVDLQSDTVYSLSYPYTVSTYLKKIENRSALVMNYCTGLSLCLKFCAELVGLYQLASSTRPPRVLYNYHKFTKYHKWFCISIYVRTAFGPLALPRAKNCDIPEGMTN